ncbi:hypothetical protein COOONC_11134 [Cooperia oncophora]
MTNSDFHAMLLTPSRLCLFQSSHPQIDDGNTATSQGTRKRGTKRGRPTKNPVWTFFRRIDDKSVQCNMCARLVKSACATNMSKHLERHHQNAAAVTTPSPIDQVDFNAHKYDQSVVSRYDVHQPPPWNPYSQAHAATEARTLILNTSFCGWSRAMITTRTCKHYSAPYQVSHGMQTDEVQKEIVERNIR